MSDENCNKNKFLSLGVTTPLDNDLRSIKLQKLYVFQDPSLLILRGHSHFGSY